MATGPHATDRVKRIFTGVWPDWRRGVHAFQNARHEVLTEEPLRRCCLMNAAYQGEPEALECSSRVGQEEVIERVALQFPDDLGGLLTAAVQTTRHVGELADGLGRVVNYCKGTRNASPGRNDMQ